jgi:signal transduction histidine kinase
MCDPNWVRQVLVSLIRNAIRHARDGGVVRLAAQAEDGKAALTVSDHGPGIAPETLPRIFDRFAQGGGSAKSQGFGIGLSLARWVIEAQNGSITAQSPLPAANRPEGVIGTSIRICLPLRKG